MRLCQFMSGLMRIFSQWLTQPLIDTATPKEKDSLMFTDPVFDFGVAFVNQILRAAIDKYHLRKGSGND